MVKIALAGLPPSTWADPRDGLFVDLSRGPEIRILAVAEPAGGTDLDVGVVALNAFRRAIAWSREEDPVELLRSGFDAANDALNELNATAGANVRQRRFSGLTAAWVDSERIVIACAPPALAVLIDGLGGGEVLNGGDRLPLGSGAVARPQLVSRPCVNGQQLLLASTQLEAVCPEWIAQAGDADAESLAALAQAHGVGDALASVTPIASVVAPAYDQPIEPMPTEQHATSLGADTDLSPELMRIPRIRRAVTIDRMRQRVIEVGERILPERKEPTIDDVPGRLRAAPTGNHSVSRYTNHGVHGLGTEVRTVLPRGISLGTFVRIAVISALIIGIIGGLTFGDDVRQDRAARQDRSLITASQEIEAANSASSQAAAEQHYANASRALDDARSRHADSELIAQLDAALIAGVDALHGIQRLGGATRLSTLPNSIQPASARIVKADDHLFVIDNAVYLLAKTTGKFDSVLSPGQVVDGQLVSNVVAAATAGGELYVTDGDSLFHWADGRWSGESLPPAPKDSRWNPVAIDIYDGNLYLLDGDLGTIIRFRLVSLSEEPNFWVEEESLPAVKGGVGLVIDGSIRLIREDGTVQTFFRGKAQGVISITTKGKSRRPDAITGNGDTATIYITERVNGESQFVRYDLATSTSQRFLMPAPTQPGYDTEANSALSNSQEFIVDEAAGLIYFLSGRDVWTVQIPVNPAA